MKKDFKIPPQNKSGFLFRKFHPGTIKPSPGRVGTFQVKKRAGLLHTLKEKYYGKGRPQNRGWLSLKSKFALAVLFFMGTAVILGPFLLPIDPLAQDIAQRLKGFSLAHPFGTDQYGRDILARLLTGGRWSLLGAVVVCLGTSIVGFSIGALAATGGGLVDNLVSRLVEAFQALPGIVLALSLTAILGSDYQNLLLALVLTNWPWYARTYRSLILKERMAPYIEGARAVGIGPLRILFKHILPNIARPAIVIATINFGAVILNLSALSFIGLGIQPPTPEWGNMINEARLYFQSAPNQIIGPGLCIFLCVLAVNLLSDSVRV